MGWIIVIVLGLLVVSIIIADIIEMSEKKKEERRKKEISDKVERERLEEERVHHEQLNNLLPKYGEPTREIMVYGENTHPENLYVYIFEKDKKIVLKNKIYDFRDIIGYNIKMDNQTTVSSSLYSKTKTDLGNMVGRTIGGAMIGGGIGAIIGGTTSSKETEGEIISETNTRHTYVLYIKINSISNPIIPLDFSFDYVSLEELTTILDIIVNLNKSN